ncbi:transaldolase [Marispirochaeta aestuarii]|uniref:Transaldolase n=1 Tax=Marispirochaeta aestuarii TaxID=1963862 RepID=A0A1Y1S0T0_9SPIO|nr:transaldolase family protein [Marispirochaeta aestuarii]ORC35964.1 transaldolase [Marispirochaeta aestuarii]
MKDAKLYGPLHEMAETTCTDFWNDSCSVNEMSYAIENGAVGGTSNPVIVGNVLKAEFEEWKPRLKALIDESSDSDEETLAWRIIEEMTMKAAILLHPIFEKSNGKKGRLSIQTNPRFFRNSEVMVDQAIHFASLYPNNNIKIPVTKAGIETIEELTYKGVSINATVCFTVPQSIAVAEAVERGISRRAKEGIDSSTMSPICTIMVGRLDDWLKIVADRKGIITDPGYFEWAGVATLKKAYKIFKERGYSSRLLAAAYRNHMHWSQFIGGELSMTIPYGWQKKFNSSDITVKDRIDDPVDDRIIDELYRKFPDFQKAYDEEGLTLEEFESFGATRRTLRSFIEGYDKLLQMIRDLMLSDPDIQGE